MTKRQTTAGKQARALAARTGRSYADALRAVRTGSAALTVRTLLMECTVQPTVPEPSPPIHGDRCPNCIGICEWVPQFRSELLNAEVAVDSVLLLAGALPLTYLPLSADTPVVVEPPDALGIQLRIGQRRFRLGTKSARCEELCAQPGCHWSARLEGRCFDHLTWDDPNQALASATEWAREVLNVRHSQFYAERELVGAALACGVDGETLIEAIAEHANRNPYDADVMLDDEVRKILASARNDHRRLLRQVVETESRLMGWLRRLRR
ncbi:hypothetical protein ACFV4P_34485 [Kitasatospora sp. NPDC059795]|uniref:hypothetical protein n=1 Tax=Kitasatospora sp. NPDC059795 TaxID=3346949 RepID=UPI003651660B